MTHTTRRESLRMAALAALGACYGGPIAAPARHTKAKPEAPATDPFTLWYEAPADAWVEALPIGSGRIGAMVFGGTESERLALNEDTLWAGGPYDPTNADALAALPEVRKLIFAGRYREADAVAKARMMGKPIRQMPYQMPCDVLLSFPLVAPVTGYRRELRLDTAVARARYTSGGVTFTRDAFASPVDHVVAVQIAADRPGHVGFDLRLRTPQTAETSPAASGTLVLRGKNGSASGIDGALSFVVRVEAIATGGSTSTRDGVLSVRDADAAMLLVAVATSYKGFRDVSGDAAVAAEERIARAREKGAERLLFDHVTEHRRLYGRVAIDLGTTDAALLPTDERVRRSGELDDPALAALYFQYGRYLLLGCSRPGGQPANLQGLWNESLDPPWGCKYTININTEMNYWPAEAANLAECVEPLAALVNDLTETGAHTARTHYGARGWVAHHNTDLWRAAAPVDGPQWGLWPMGGAWLSMTLWDQYDYGRDRAVLAAIYPVMKGAAEFFLDTLVEEPSRKWLVTCPSLSPENVHPYGTSLCAGPSMDAQILRDLFAHCIEAGETLGVDAPFRAALADARARLPPHQIGAAGQLQEWLDDWDMQAPEIHHRHVSHLYALFPSSQITVDGEPALAAAARKSLEIRGDEATGWGIAWRLNLWARLGEGDHAHDILRMLFDPSRTYPNLFDAHPPFQIDGNFGGVSGILEMLVQSHSGAIALLPALPSAWRTGSIHGVRARGGFEIDLAWSEWVLDSADFRGAPGSTRPIRYRGQTAEVSLGPRGRARVWLDAGTLRAEATA